MTKTASALAGKQGEKIALTDVAIRADIADLLDEVTVIQTYRNDETVNIEAVYTFPLPHDAVLLEFEVRLGERLLQGVVTEKKQAATRYEKAIADGDAAVMLEAIEPGLYTVNVGNLLPGESASLSYRYAVVHRWTGDHLRIFMPTTVAPRYGVSLHQPQQVPAASLTVENRFTLELSIAGALTQAQFDCPSHDVTLSREDGRMLIRLARDRAVMDRDFVLNVRAPQATRSFAIADADGDGTVLMANFQPFFPGLRQPAPIKVAFVVDCSGSMAGESIQQVRSALAGILDRLRPEDKFTILAFGSTTSPFCRSLTNATAETLDVARGFVRSLDANMGGTEIGRAFADANAAIGPSPGTDIFLITDGEVADWRRQVAYAARLDHRVFSIGVGNAVSESFVRALAEATGGQCELVAPREDMAERVIRHFERMRAPRARAVRVRWPDGVEDFTPQSFSGVFEGDTVRAWARAGRADVTGEVTLEVETQGGDIGHQSVPIRRLAGASARDNISTLARLGGAIRLSPEAALRYRLVSEWTNYLVVDRRAEGSQAIDLPALRQVPHMLAAGWGGTGLADPVADYSALPAGLERNPDGLLRMSMRVDPMSFAMPAAAQPVARFAAFGAGKTNFDALLGGVDDELNMEFAVEPTRAKPPTDPDLLHATRRLAALIATAPDRLAQGSLVDLLTDAGLLPTCEPFLKQARDGGLEIERVAALLLRALLEACTLGIFSRVPDRIWSAFLEFARKSEISLRQAAPGRDIERTLRQRNRHEWRRLLKDTEAAEKAEADEARAVG